MNWKVLFERISLKKNAMTTKLGEELLISFNNIKLKCDFTSGKYFLGKRLLSVKKDGV